MRGIERYIKDLLRGRRPRAFRASPDEAALARTAVTLRAARPGSGAPAEEFAASLHKRLAAELDGAPSEPGAPARPRRAFIRDAACAACAVGAAGAALDHLLTPHGAAPVPDAGRVIVPDQGCWQAALASADLPDGTVRPFTLATLAGFVERRGGRLQAVSGICTHQGCRLVLAQSGSELDCPCHGAVFALDGTVISHRLSVRLTALPSIEVRESGGVVQVYAPPPPSGGPPVPGH